MSLSNGRVLLAEGREAEVFSQPDGTVLKLMRLATDMPRVETEAAVCRLLVEHGHGAPVVREIVTVEGRPGLVMERIPGTDLLAALERQPLRVVTAARVLATVHAALHEHPAPPGLPKLKDELGARITGGPLGDDLKEVALQVLDELPDGDRLCHGDLHLGNILGTWDAPVVIDWAGATRGDPAGDVARTDLLHRIGELPPGTPLAFRAVARVGRRLLVGRYLALYQRRRPLDDSLDRWWFVHAAARLMEPIPEEHPKLLRLIEQSAASMCR